MYEVIQIDPKWLINDEQLGTKEKFWFEKEGKKWLFKKSREIVNGVYTGEDWSEKIAHEVAKLIGVESAVVELALFKGEKGSASLSFMPSDDYHLEHGNEILAGYIVDYQKDAKYNQGDHSIINIIKVIRQMFFENDSDYVLTKLAGYLVLDALILNVDRHHENWGLFWVADASKYGRLYHDVAPSYDHASSLGRELTSDSAALKIKNKTIHSYVEKAKGGVFFVGGDKRNNPLVLIEKMAPMYPDYFRPALRRLKEASIADICATLDDVPNECISQNSRSFAKMILQSTYERLMGVKI